MLKRLRALRAFSLPVSVLPVVVAVAAVRTIGRWDWPVLVASVLGVALLHLAGNLLNDYFDFGSGVDRKVDGDEGRPGRLLVRGELAPRDVLATAVACLALAAPIAAFLVWRCGSGLLWFAMAAVVGLYAYTGPPLKLKYRAMGEVLIFVVFGLALMLGAAYAQTGRLEWSAFVASLPIGAATTAILVGNNLRDRQEDRDAGIRTLAHVAGGSVARMLYLFLLVASAFGLVALAAADVVPLTLLGAPVLLVLAVKPIAWVWRAKRLADIDVRTARFAAVLSSFMLLSYILQSRS